MMIGKIVSKPYRLLAAPYTAAREVEWNQHDYVTHTEFAVEPRYYLASLRILQIDLLELFQFIEPADANLETFSHRVHELLVRICIEIEAHFYNILMSNTPELKDKKRSPNIVKFKEIDRTHSLSKFLVRYPGWRGDSGVWAPFEKWSDAASREQPAWWQAYNDTKHRRHELFEKATLGHLMEAFTALIVVYHSQYRDEDFSSESESLQMSAPGYDTNDGMKTSIAAEFRIRYPRIHESAIVYDFNWLELKQDKTGSPIQCYNYSDRRESQS